MLVLNKLGFPSMLHDMSTKPAVQDVHRPLRIIYLTKRNRENTMTYCFVAQREEEGKEMGRGELNQNSGRCNLTIYDSVPFVVDNGEGLERDPVNRTAALRTWQQTRDRRIWSGQPPSESTL